LKVILDELVINDDVIYEMNEIPSIEYGKEYEIEFKYFQSDRLLQKINEYNQKKELNNNHKIQLSTEDIDTDETETSEDEETNTKKKKKFNPIKISINGLELIELVSLDCSNSEGIWHSDTEIKIDKNGYMITNGRKIKQFWDFRIRTPKKPLRMKIRNIAGDESIIIV
jgi:adenine-specific DNA-methyltransferase